MTASSRPYLLRALYEWLLDNQLTPHIIIAAHEAGVDVPQEQAQDGQLVLNISDTATRGLQISNEALTFSARFAGIPRQVYIPMHAVVAIYGRENGAGMVFGQEPSLTEADPPPKPTPVPSKKASKEHKDSTERPRPSHLTVIK